MLASFSENYLLRYINLVSGIYTHCSPNLQGEFTLHVHTHTHTQNVVAHTKKLNIIQVGKMFILIIKRGEREGREGREGRGKGERREGG